MIIANCAITLTDAELLKPCVMSKSDPEFAKLKVFHTGLDISADKVFSVYKCRVAYIGSESSGRTIVLQTGSSFCICYKRMKELQVSLNDILDPTYFVGTVDKYVHMEVYLKEKSQFPVSIGNDVWYKADANLALNGGLSTRDVYSYKETYNYQKTEYVTDLTNSIMNNSSEE